MVSNTEFSFNFTDEYKMYGEDRNGRFVSKNMSNAEYIDHLALQNRLKQERNAKSKDRQN